MSTKALSESGEPRTSQCENCANCASGDVASASCPRRTEIALAARTLIVEKGLEGLRTRDVAARAGINIATLHYHVPTKEALIGLVAETTRKEFCAIHDARPRDGMSPTQLLKREIDIHCQLLADQPELLKIMSEFFERSRRDLMVRQIYSELRLVWSSRLIALFKVGALDGSFRADLDPESASDIFISALVAGSRRHFQDPARLQIFFSELQRCF